MTTKTFQELLEAGVHFGAPANTWNPLMGRFIHGKRNRIHIINLVHTLRGMAQATHFLREVAQTGRQIVYVCTKRQMKGLLRQEADRAEMPWVTERWLGGTLTNFKTVRSRLSRLEELEAMEEAGEFDLMSKKAVSRLSRESRRITKNLGGLRNLSRIPGAIVVIDPKREHIAIAEANRVGVPVVSLLDTDCDPGPVDIPIPANDDSIRAVTMLLTELTDAVMEGVEKFKESGRPPEDAVGQRSGDQVTAISPEEMLETSGLADQITAAAETEEGTPTEETPAEEAPTEETPAEEAPTEEAPTEEAPAEEAPAEEAPAEEAPAEEAPTEEAPSEDGPSDEETISPDSVQG
ncbi:MAG: 30S ribosomal protein S2 [Planctomycetota bacterium]|nr:30S ribosomal protein S2 [Planctomycetota bacterium]